MEISIFIFALVPLQTFSVMALAQLDEDSITDEKKFLVVGVLSGGSRSVYSGEQVNDQIYSTCMIERGYKIWERN